MYTADPEAVKAKYNLGMLREIENLVAEAVEIQVPFNNYITGWCAFTHKAGIHAKAILNNPSTYEILNPEDFGMTRYVSIGYASFFLLPCHASLFPLPAAVFALCSLLTLLCASSRPTATV
jgi:hypothetical protein